MVRSLRTPLTPCVRESIKEENTAVHEAEILAEMVE